MSFGRLSNHFEGVAAKRLSEVETNPTVSNQHELNGVQPLKRILGDKPEKISFDAQFIYLGEDEDDTIIDEGTVTWYDARAKNPKRTEHRFYYTSNQVIDESRSGDLLLIAKQKEENILFLVAKEGSTFENQLLWLFSLQEASGSGKFITRKMVDDEDREIGFAGQLILRELGIETEGVDRETFLEKILEEFGESWPSTREFSKFVRATIQGVSSLDNPDEALIIWMEREELMFRALEKHLVEERIDQGFEGDVDKFISFSLSVHNRRKVRAGRAFENHLEYIFVENEIEYSRGARTEGRKTPDFLFPGISYYKGKHFPDDRLTMLGAKTTCKDRWRQVLTEANKIETKHLVTLEAGISENQTNEMRTQNLQLVIPEQLKESFNGQQRSWLMNMDDFISLVRSRQDSLTLFGSG